MTPQETLAAVRAAVIRAVPEETVAFIYGLLV